MQAFLLNFNCGGGEDNQGCPYYNEITVMESPMRYLIFCNSNVIYNGLQQSAGNYDAIVRYALENNTYFYSPLLKDITLFNENYKLKCTVDVHGSEYKCLRFKSI